MTDSLLLALVSTVLIPSGLTYVRLTWSLASDVVNRPQLKGWRFRAFIIKITMR